MKINIKEYLESLPKDETIYYFPNPGNGGDSLIACATFQVFDQLGLRYKPLPKDSSKADLEGKILICPGGGNLIGYYPNTREVIKEFHDSVRKLIILPHTIFGHEDLLGQLEDNVEIITREETSYNYVSGVVKNAKVFLTDDMAFSLDMKQVMNQIPLLFPLWMTATIPSRRIQKGNYFEVQQYLKMVTNQVDGEILNAFRTDREKTDVHIPEGNLDIAEFFSYGTTRKRSIYATHRLLSFVNQYAKIRTNRLHTCIAGALLGKEVEFYANSYWKCEAVYKFSMKEKFPKVKWMS